MRRLLDGGARWVAVLAVAVAAPSCSSDGGVDEGSATTTTTPSATPQAPPSTAPAQPSGSEPSAAPTPVSRPTGATFTTPSSITADCSQDVTPQLAGWIASVPDNSVLSFPTGACYRIDTTLVIQERSQLLLEGHGATLKAVTEGDRNRDHLRITKSSNVIVHDLIVRGANPQAGTSDAAYRPDREAQHAFNIVNGEGVVLDHVQAYDVYGDFVYIGGVVMSRNVTVGESRFERSGRQGIAVTNAEHVLIERNEIAEVGRSLFDLEPNKKTGRAQHVQLLSNTTGAAKNFWLASKGAGSEVGNVAIRGNVMRAATGGLIWVRSPAQLPARRGFNIGDNTFLALGGVSDEGSVGAFFFQNCADIAISGNRVMFEEDRAMPAVELRASTRVEIKGNQFDGSARDLEADPASTEIDQG